MASKAVAKAAGGVMSINQKQCLQSAGIWERVRRLLAVDPERSSGVPLNPYFRNPTPGAGDPLAYDDPVTTPAGDIADNPYWKRDARRAYPRLSYVNQGLAVGLLSVGSAAAPRGPELVGEAGRQALVAVAEEGRDGGIAALAQKKGGKEVAAGLLVDGLPPLPSGQRLKVDEGKWEAKRYELTEENAYPGEYPCRTFE